MRARTRRFYWATCFGGICKCDKSLCERVRHVRLIRTYVDDVKPPPKIEIKEHLSMLLERATSTKTTTTQALNCTHFSTNI